MLDELVKLTDNDEPILAVLGMRLTSKVIDLS
jgi:hypothetical protein